MASNASFADADPQMGPASGLYGAQNGGTSPGQQQQHMPTDADLQLQDNLVQLQRGTELMHPGAPLGQQMNPLNAAHHHFQTPPRPNHSPQQMAQSVMSLDEHNIYSDQDGASRKRSKVSRACDECRRKKIRCDATSENGPEACSSCKRTGARCQFSRQPMKRGPSKGYIKELADRLNSLENQIQNPHLPSQPFDYAGINDQGLGDAHAPSNFDRKRTHSMSEGLHDPYNSRLSWPVQDRDIVPNGSNARRPSYSDLTLAGSLITGSNEGTIRSYYTSIHPFLPILSRDSPSLNRLGNCPSKLREAFFLALECGVRSVAPAALPAAETGLPQMIQQCSETLEAAQYTISDPENSRQIYNNIVYCQSLLFALIATDKSGPDASGSSAELLGRLAGRISDLGLNDFNVVAALRDQDRENFDDSRRLFWVTFILDRFHAASKTKDIVLPLHVGSVSRDDLGALGEAGFHLARAADIIGQVAYVTKAGNVPNLDTSSPFAFASLTLSSPNALYLTGQLTRLRESLEITDLPNNSAPYLAFQYLRILVARLSAFTSSKETLLLTKDLLDHAKSLPISPLHHFFTNLIATALTELSDRIETQVDAHAAVKELEDAITIGQLVHRAPNGVGWDSAIRSVLHQRKAQSPSLNISERTSPTTRNSMAGLQHLAAAAVGERQGADTRPPSSGGNGNLAQASQDVKHDVTAAMAAASEAAAAQATAAAALQNSSGNSNGGSNFDPSAFKDSF